MKVILAAGGSGGHIFPAVALASELEKEKGTVVYFVSSKRQLDLSILGNSKYNCFFLSVNPMPLRFNILRIFTFVFKFALDMIASFGIIIKTRPDIVVGFGGYSTGTIVLCARIFNIPVIIHEQNFVPGRANRLLRGAASRVAVSFKGSEASFSDVTEKVFYSGNPLRHDILGNNKEAAQARLGLSAEWPVILIMGGSQGASSLNSISSEAARRIHSDRKGEVQFIHLTGKKDHDRIRAFYKENGMNARVYSFMDRIDDAYAASDIAISRSGAAAVFELAYYAKPMILVPYPNPKNNQRTNAIYFSERGAAVYREEKDLSPEWLADEVSGILNDNTKKEKLSKAARGLCVPDAAKRLAEEVLTLAYLKKKKKERYEPVSVNYTSDMKKIHFIGIGGIGMSALAGIHLARGGEVSGSDLRPNDLTEDLRKRGAEIYEGHREENLSEDVDIAVRSTCIRDGNPEIIKAESSGINVLGRGELLKAFMEDSKDSIAVTGTHGKTTTSALVSHIAENCGEDPTVVVGGEMERFGSNAKSGCGDLFIAEVDESDGYFRNISSGNAIVTNIEREHMEHYGSMENLLSAFREFMWRISPDGVLIYNGEDRVLGEIVRSTGRNALSFGVEKGSDITCSDHQYAGKIEFDLIIKGKKFGRVTSPLMGRYNLMNILGAMGMCMEKGMKFDDVAGAISSFRGVKRRFEIIGSVGGIKVIEDYAHHPTELRSVIRAARESGAARVISIFQPHRYSRTKDLLSEFADCFYDSDVLILTDIYSADENIDDDTNASNIYDIIDKDRFDMVECKEKENIPEYVSGIVKDNDMVLVLGAGDIREISTPVYAKIKERFMSEGDGSGGEPGLNERGKKVRVDDR